MQTSKTQVGFLGFLESIIRRNALLYYLIRNIVIYFNIFEEDFKILTKYFKDKKINIIDVGASDGISANFFLKNLNVNKIYCYEPHKIFIKNLVKYKKDNKKIILKKYGISSRENKIIVYYPSIKFFGLNLPLLTYTFYDKSELKKQIKLSVPMGSQEMMIAVGYSFFYKIMSIIGIVELATTQLLFTVMHASFMPAMGVGQACATLVGKYMGSKEIEKSEQSIKESLRIAEYIMGTMGIIFILFPKFILLLFTSDPNILQLGVWGLRLIGFLQFIDAICFTLFLALTGAGNTLFPALVESSLIWGFMLPFSYYTGVVLGGGFKSPFIAFAIYLFLMAIILSLKMKKGDWKEIDV